MAELVGGEVMYSDGFNRRIAEAEIALRAVNAQVSRTEDGQMELVLTAAALAQAVQLDRITELLDLLVRLSAN
jgi:hypothetical protein